MIARELLRYLFAFLIPLALLAAALRFDVRSYFIEQVMTLVIVVIAVRWRLGPAMVTVVTAVAGDNVLLREPVGRPTITGVRDAADLVLFSVIAMTVAWLVASAQRERMRAIEAADRERAAREERDRLIAIVSHDLAAPISAIRGAVQFARRSSDTERVDLGRLLVRVETAAQRANSLIRLLRDAHGLEEGLLRLNVRDADLADVVRPVIEMLDRASERHPMVLATPAGPVPVRCDVERMERVVESLVTNAIKYSPAGGRVEVSLTVVDESAVLTVRDYGIGIPADAAGRIFERSFRAPNAMGTAPGLGLGLHTSAEIVRRHGGTIDARSESGGGATFIVRLPLRPLPDGREAAARRAGVETPRPERPLRVRRD